MPRLKARNANIPLFFLLIGGFIGLSSHKSTRPVARGRGGTFANPPPRKRLEADSGRAISTGELRRLFPHESSDFETGSSDVPPPKEPWPPAMPQHIDDTQKLNVTDPDLDVFRQNWKPIQIHSDAFPTDMKYKQLESAYRKRFRERWVIRRISDLLKDVTAICEELDSEKNISSNTLVEGILPALLNLTVADPIDSLNKAPDNHKADREYVKIVIQLESIMDDLKENYNYVGLNDEFLELDQGIWGERESRRRMRQLLDKAKLIKWRLDTDRWWQEAREYVKAHNSTIYDEFGIHENETYTAYKHYISEPDNSPTLQSRDPGLESPDSRDMPGESRDSGDGGGLEMEASALARRVIDIVEYMRREHRYSEFDPEVDMLFEDIGEQYDVRKNPDKKLSTGRPPHSDPLCDDDMHMVSNVAI
ncbi:hypothetical protein AAMO2058_000918400 [Amorphochlora amoebiformis]